MKPSRVFAVSGCTKKHLECQDGALVKGEDVSAFSLAEKVKRKNLYLLHSSLFTLHVIQVTF